MLFSLVDSTAKHKIKLKQKNNKSFVVPWTWTKDLLGNWVEGEGFLGVGDAEFILFYNRGVPHTHCLRQQVSCLFPEVVQQVPIS